MAASAASVHQAATKSAATNNGGLPSSHHNADLVQQAKLPDSSAGIQPQPQSKYKVLYEAVKQADPAVVRQVVRDLSSQCLLGSDYHNVFVAGLVLNNASSTAVEQTIREYGKKMVRLCKQQIIDHLTSQDLDTLSDSILAKAGSSFLDKALARRLETIPARSLVNALARAERLGYEVQDVVEEHSEKPGYEHVVPSLGSSSSHPMVIHDETTNPPCTGPRPNAVQLAEQQPSQQPSQQLSPLVQATLAKSNAAVGPFGIRYCHACSRPCTGTDALLVHTQKAACRHALNLDGLGANLCIHCGSFFTSPGGLSYHLKRKVCGQYSEEATQQVYTELRARSRHSTTAAPVADAPATNAMTGFSSPVPVHTPLPRPNPTAQHHMPDDSKLSVAQTPESADLDPYAKLSPEAKNALERDMEDAARKYGTYIQEAMKKPGISDAERELMVNRYKNSYNTKQSMIRKKYGIRLRERRPRAMIEEDRKRLLGMYAGETTPAAKKSHTTDHSLAGSAMLGSKVDNAGHGSREALQAALTAKTSGGLTASAGTAAFTDPTIANKSAQARAAAQPRFSTSKVLSDVMQIDGESNYEDDESTDDDDIPAQLTGQKFSRA